MCSDNNLTINAGCFIQEVDALLSENEMLQGKLHSQEEDFRLQNSTLMTELSKVTITVCVCREYFRLTHKIEKLSFLSEV